jgi:hypothetical protein
VSRAVREARLKREHADLYPGIEPDVWEVAANVAERLFTRLVWAAGPEYILPHRVLDDDHFEFRGGLRMPRPRTRARTRWGDQRAERT